MGEARRKLAADAAGIPRPRDRRCPACGSGKIMFIPRGKFPPDLAHFVDSDIETCHDCRAMWEPFPDVYVRDVVCAEPCDNCAFRPGSPEQRDPVRWRELMSALKPAPSDDYGFNTGWFYCHKGVAIDMTKGPGNFLFPKRPLTLDGEPVRNPDGTVKMIEDTRRMRTCSGFLQVVWRHRDKKGAAP